MTRPADNRIIAYDVDAAGNRYNARIPTADELEAGRAPRGGR